MKKKLIKLLAIVLTVVLGSVGCNKDKNSNLNESQTVEEYNIQKSDYIHLTMIFPETINPILNKNKSVGYIMNLVYDGLFDIDEDYNIKPSLVDKYSVSSNGKTVSISLNSNAKWHNNKKVTSEDVDFTVNLIKKNSESPYATLVENIKSINILDSKNFTISLKENDPFILDKLTFPIISKNKMEKLKGVEISEFKNNFVGNGPYKIKKYEDRQYIILERNEDYFGDLPENRKEIYVKMVPDKESQTEMVLALDSDIANITLADLSKFEGKKEFNITKYEGRDYEMVMFNYENVYLNDANFRKAIISSIDREKLIKEAYVGNATINNFPLNTKSRYYNSNIKGLSYDKDKALEYLVKGLKSIDETLDEKNKGEDKEINPEELKGIVEDNATKSETTSELTKKEIKEMLKDVELKIVVSENNGERIKVAQIIKESLARIGINTVINELNEKDLTKSLDSKDYDLAVVGYSLSSIPDARYILNECNINDKKLSTYIINLGNSTSEDETKKIYGQIQKYVVEKGSFISLGILDNFVVFSKRLEGNIHPNDFDIYKGISNLQMSK